MFWTDVFALCSTLFSFERFITYYFYVRPRPMTYGPTALSFNVSSDQFKMVSTRSEKPICAPPRLSDVSPTLPLKRL